MESSWTRGPIIGRGSSATVSIATANGSGEVFAVKSAELSKSEFVQREQKILSSLSSCPQIIAYRGCDISTENGRVLYNLRMEYAPGGTLSDEVRLRNGWLKEAEIRSYTRQILMGLEFLHSEGIVHCDIKGQNVLVAEEGVIKIADLGCARRVREVSGADWKPIAGTPVYMAPEVARGEQQGFPADLWALGCTIIEMATGKAPWADESDPVSVLYRVGFSNCGPEIPCFMSQQAKDFLSKCLKRDPLERWSASELLDHVFLEEPEFCAEESDISKLDSPRSVLDCGLWESESDDDLEKSPSPTHQRSTKSPLERIRGLSEGSEMWGMEMDDWDEEWVTVRDNGKKEHTLDCNDLFDGIDTKWGRKGYDLVSSPIKYSTFRKNCKASKGNANFANSNSYRDRDRDRERGSFTDFECFRDVICGHLNFNEKELWFFMQPSSFVVNMINISFNITNSRKNKHKKEKKKLQN